MIKAVSLAILAGGIVLLILGINASNSFGSEVKELFTGSPSDRAVWYLTAGVVLIVGGVAGFAVGAKKKG
jgi:hypothetical protein